MRTHAHLWFLGLLTGLVLLGVATIPAAAQPRTPVKIAVLQAAFVYFTPYVAEAKGFFAKHGLDAQLVYFRSGGETTTAVVAGIVRKEVDLPNAGRGYPAVIRDLKGLKLGMTGRGASTDFTLRFLLKEAGLDPDKDVTIIATGGVPTTLAALQKGDIQGFLGFEPIQSQAIYGFQVAKPVLDIRKGEGPRMLRDYAYNSMVAREDYLAAHPDVARRMVEAVVDTQRFLQDPKNFEETVKIAEKYFEGIDPRLLRPILQDSIKAYQPVITRQAVANIGEMLAGAGLIKRPLVFEDVVDTRFAPTKFP